VAGPISTGLPPNSIAVMSDDKIITAVLEEAAAVPQAARLMNAFPNPFNAGTQIPFAVEGGQGQVSLVVYDMLGRQIRSLVDGLMPIGSHAVIWDGLDDTGAVVGNGAYLVELRTGALRATGKLMLLK
ncbi:MAG: T9SS type A sorting domain-containing protein, partial [Gemmatimonadetes bacterium]|nr:T9SS type A sorting domain-containing protein [Gemmatimonadota bacterium]